MIKHGTKLAALVSSAAFLFSSYLYAQAPIIDSSARYQADNEVAAPAAPAPAAATPAVQGELFYQLQLLQEEVRQLRGLVEDQAHQLADLKQQTTDRYIDIDRRLANAPQQLTTAVSSEASDTATGDVAEKAGEKDAFYAAFALVRENNFKQAIAAFKTFVADYPDGKFAPNAYYWLGGLYMKIEPNDLEGARQAFSQVVNLAPKHPKAADSMYKLGTVYFVKDNKEKARYWLEKTVSDYSGGASPAADKAKEFLRDNF